MSQKTTCYQLCNSKYTAIDPQRLFCKKGCDADSETLKDCKNEDCSKLCIKEELGDEDHKLQGWSRFFQRAPTDPTQCLNACFYGCENKDDD